MPTYKLSIYIEFSRLFCYNGVKHKKEKKNMINHPAVQLFLRLAKVSSPSYFEKAMVDEIIKVIGELGWQCEFIRQEVDMAKISQDIRARYTEEELQKKTEQLIVKIKGNDNTKAKTFYCAHIDTVTPADNINPIIEGDKIVTDKTTVLGSDDKSGVAAMIIAVDEILKSGEKHGDIALFFTALEEKGCIGASQIDLSSLDLDYGFVFDTTESVGKMVVRTQHVQGLDVNIEVANIPNHANSCTVENALGYAARMIAALDRSLRSQADMTFTQVTKLTCEYDKGYMVPYKATFKLTLRSFSKEAQQKMVEQAKEIVDSFKDKDLSVNYILAPAQTQGYSNYDYETGKLMLEKGAKALKSIGIEPVYSGNGLGSHDANKFISKGLPSLVFSCGMQQIHTVNEWIYIKDIVDTTRLIKALIQNA